MGKSQHERSRDGWEVKVSVGLLLWASLLAAGVSSDCPSSDGRYRMPGLNVRPYMKRGDLNLGAVISLTRRSTTADACSQTPSSSPYALQMTEAIAYAVQMVNEDPNLLPNVTMGFAVVDGCGRQSVTLASCLAFLPLQPQSCGNQALTCRADVSQTSTHHDVIGIIGPGSSVSTVPVSSLYSVAHLPILGYTATSDTLSDKTQHPYYFRVVPPDKHQVEAMLKFISGNGWSYISVVYMQGAYGEKAFDNIKEMSPSFGICVATHHRLITNVDYNDIASKLVENPRARVVVLFTGTSQVSRLFEAVRSLNYTHHFIWIGSDGWAYGFETRLAEHRDMTIGAFSFTFYSLVLPEFYEYVRNLSVANSDNPVLKSTWEYLANCSFDGGTCDPSENILLRERNSFYPYSSLLIDGVLSFAHAADGILRDTCPHAHGREARNCITGELLKEYLKNTSFYGTTGHIEFDEYNDVKGRYLIRQIVHDVTDNSYLRTINHTTDVGLVARDIGTYYTESKTIVYSGRNISWSHLDRLKRIIPLKTGLPDDGRPESVCSRPCVNGEYKIEKELSCCWECRRCRNNERVVPGNTTCEACPAFTWPDASQNYTACTSLPVTYPSLRDSLPILLFCMAFVASLFTVVVILAYVKYRNERVIKAASRELSFLQLGAIFLGYVTVMISQLKPSEATCKLTYLLFCFSFAWLYCPLLVKTVRIFRIFTNSTKTNSRPRFVSPQSQLVMCSVLLGVQMLLCVVTIANFDPSSRRDQPVWTERLVELTCDLTLPGLASFLAYNLVLVTLCSVFAFKTRKLPDNFNESRFISMCVFTTLVIWLAFIPTYFTAGRVFVKALLLSVALLLNHSVALLFLFVPKIYAAVWLPAEQGNFVTTRFQTQGTVAVSGPPSFQQRSSAGTGIGNRVTPSLGLQPQQGFEC